jgi:hypothetical protein
MGCKIKLWGYWMWKLVEEARGWARKFSRIL